MGWVGENKAVFPIGFFHWLPADSCRTLAFFVLSSRRVNLALLLFSFLAIYLRHKGGQTTCTRVLVRFSSIYTFLSVGSSV